MRNCIKCHQDISSKRSDAIFCSKKCKKDSWHRKRYQIPAKRLSEEERKAKRSFYRKRWKENNRDKHLANMRKYCKERYHNDINYRLAANLRNRLNIAISNYYKSGSAVKNLGCSITKLKIYLQLKFHRNPRNRHEYMTWSNQGQWYIDHIKPLSSFDLTDPLQLKEACNYTNLQPLWATDNIKKG